MPPPASTRACVETVAILGVCALLGGRLLADRRGYGRAGGVVVRRPSVERASFVEIGISAADLAAQALANASLTTQEASRLRELRSRCPGFFAPHRAREHSAWRLKM